MLFAVDPATVGSSAVIGAVITASAYVLDYVRDRRRDRIAAAADVKQDAATARDDMRDDFIAVVGGFEKLLKEEQAIREKQEASCNKRLDVLWVKVGHLEEAVRECHEERKDLLRRLEAQA